LIAKGKSAPGTKLPTSALATIRLLSEGIRKLAERLSHRRL
jgi:hypothetical protein